MATLPCLVLFTKPVRAGRVKTRLIGARVGGRVLDGEDAGELHGALLGDMAERLAAGAGRDFQLRVAWDLEPGEGLPALPGELLGRSGVDAVRQRGRDLGERLFEALSAAAGEHPLVAAVGSDHPTLPLAGVRRAFAVLAAGEGDVALGPSEDGGYHLLALRREALSRRLFEGIAWSTATVGEETRRRCRELGLGVVELAPARDVDRAEDVLALAAEIAAREGAGEVTGCPRTRRVLAGWGLLPPAAGAIESERRACAS